MHFSWTCWIFDFHAWSASTGSPFRWCDKEPEPVHCKLVWIRFFKYTLKFCKTNLSDLERMTKFTFSIADHGPMVVYSVFVFKVILASCISKYSERNADRKWLLLWDWSFDRLPLQFSVMVIHYICLSFQCRLKRWCAYYLTEQYTFKSGSTESMFLYNFWKK
jgi:hypothetical protein